ncbi:hypothetical protein QFC22_000366 [Naganishia vaughanmartiniae]|uniref:Uncharacterized protein n=1 Tax=Naganishia vaughanmartiniae TaxID=1424756 RepID=A0ACC2XP45_9TREE|nr:hypothetical protein QFC22_000366 [Naganishia vaughanmartiniae]
MVSPIPSSASQLYVEQGLGTAAAAVEHMHALAWATETLHLGLECAEELKKMKGGIRNDYLKRNQRCPNLAHITLPLDRINIVFSRSLGWEVDRMIDAGLWISPRTIADILEEAARTHPSSDLSEFLPSIQVLEPPLRRPTTRKREWGDMTEEWAFKDRVPPRSVVTRMQRSYLELLPERIEGNLKSIRTMIARISDGNMDLAEAKAASMNVEELVQWLNDPRMHIPNWWHGQQIVKPISQSEIARALSSESSMSESITKRKRDDSDLSDDESGKATKKQDNGISNNATPGDSQAPMEVLPASTVGPPTPTGLETQATSPSTPRIESKPSLSILTPEIVNRLPWPTPQEVLSERECEYLRMTEFDETKLRNDAVYSVPASSTELDDVTRELLMYEWRSITECFSACRCSICRRAREYEKLVAAEAADPYAEYISLLGGDAKIEDMSDFQRNWLANQAALLNSSVTSPEEDFEQDELQLSEEEDWPTMRNRNELENYSDEYDYESDEEMEEVPDVDDVAYHIPGARLQ